MYFRVDRRWAEPERLILAKNDEIKRLVMAISCYSMLGFRMKSLYFNVEMPHILIDEYAILHSSVCACNVSSEVFISPLHVNAFTLSFRIRIRMGKMMEPKSEL